MLIIDRFEGDYAVVETGDGMVNIPKAELPVGAKEGSVLRLVLDEETTHDRGKRVESMMDELFR